jgi:cell shape-determining protein MreD
MAGSKTFPLTKFAMVMAFYAILACVLMPALFYYLLEKTLNSAGNGFIIGSVVSILLWNFLGYHYVKS